MPRSWLVSYQIQPVTYFTDSASFGDPYDVIEVIAVQPVGYFALLKSMENGGPFPHEGQDMERVNRLLRIYCVMEIPAGLDTQEVIDAFQP